MVERIISQYEIDSNDEIFYETEKQYLVTDPTVLESYKDSCELRVIEQLHLSHPDEPFSLRLRETASSEGISYTATLKDRGTLTSEGFRRLEIEGKEGGDFLARHAHLLSERTGLPEVSSERLAHSLFPNLMPAVPEAITPHEILARIMEFRRAGTDTIVVGISGRSGSGKTTVARQLLGLAQHHLTTAHISTDDYHLGITWLENTYGSPWTNWDAPEVYDTKRLSFDLFQLSQGLPINSYSFDMTTEEPVVTGTISPGELIIVEGIYAGSPDLSDTRHLHVAIPTPLATSVGRRIMRDMKRLNESFASPQAILRYQLETAEPTYQQQP